MILANWSFPFFTGRVASRNNVLPDVKGPLPTRTNIEREFRRLAGLCKKSDQVMILLAGHGSQQPNVASTDPTDYEPDGLDEIFLPSDVRGWDGTRGSVVNAICDDQLRVWLRNIRQKGAFVWIVVDACHSGTMVRGAPNEVVRQLRPDQLGIPAESMANARRTDGSGADRVSRNNRRFDAFEIPKDGPGGVVALYAAQSTEPTVETLLPSDAADPKIFGLLSYTINEVLSRARSPLTFRELTQAVHQRYVSAGRLSPTPLVEGTGVDREIFGTEVWRKPVAHRAVTRAGRAVANQCRRPSWHYLRERAGRLSRCGQQTCR